MQAPEKPSRSFAIQAFLTFALALAGLISIGADVLSASAAEDGLPLRCRPRPRRDEDCPPPKSFDDAVIISNTIPLSMVAGRSYDVSVTVLNTGRATWSRVGRGPADESRGYKLGAVDDRDPFYQRGTRVRLAHGVEVPPDTTYRFEFTLKAPSKPGTYITDWRMVHENVRWFGSTLVARVHVQPGSATPTPRPNPSPTLPPPSPSPPPPPRSDNDPFGVVAAPGLGNDPARMNAIHDLGVGWVRVAYDWPHMQPQSGDENIKWALVERIVNGLTSRGLKIYWDFSYSPGWANGRGGNSDDDIDYPPDPEALYNFVYSVVSRFKDDVDAWGTWNEPNLNQFYKGSKSHYMNVILPTTVRAINDADPNAFVVVGETSSSSNLHLSWLPDMLRSVRGQFDAISHHVYDGSDNCSGRVRQMDTLRSRLNSWGFGSYPVWITETGLNQSESKKSAFLTCFYDAMLDRDWWAKTFWYRFEYEERWGLVDPGGNPNQTYHAFQDFIISHGGGASSVPHLHAPEGSGVGLRPTFRWDSVEQAESYRLQVSELQGRMAIDTEVAATRYIPLQDLKQNESYTWTVAARTENGLGPNARPMAFVAGGGGTVWEHDDFEGLLMGPLNGQNGWYSGGPSPQVVFQPSRGQVLMIDPFSASSVSASKNVPAQSRGLNTLEFDVRVTGADQPSVAKIELKTNASGGWDRKFQVYFGSSMRVNYSRTGASATIVPATQLGHWYHVSLEMNLDDGTLDVWVDGQLAAADLPMHPGSIRGLSLTGWNRAGAVYLDNILGIGRSSSLSVQITNPSHGSTVSGTINVQAVASFSSTGVEFYVDGALQHTDTSAPFSYSWDTASNPLPLANHPLDLGYYFVEWKNPADFGTARAEVAEYTNLYYASRSSYVSDLGPNEWKPLLAQSMADARTEGNKVHLAMDSEALWDHILDVAAPFWNEVVRIEIEDEPSLSRAQTEAMIRRLEARLAAHGLARKPMGFVYVYTVPLPDAVNASGLDWVGIEAYLDFPGSPDSQQNITAMNTHLENNMARVPAGKDIVLVMMAYDRNGNWPNIDTLRDLQTPIYLQAHDDPRVISINMFSYTRRGGTRDHPELTTAHKLIGERALGTTIAGAGNGLRTLTVRAYDAVGNDASDRVVVTVSNPITSPTPTPGVTTTPTPSATAITLTPTITSSPTLITPTSTPTPGPSATPTHVEPTLTPSSTAIPSATPTWSPTPVASVTPTWSPTPLPTMTPAPSLTPTPTPRVVTPTPTPIPSTWEDDNFDRLATGSLNGQSGWIAGQSSPRVIPFGNGKVLEIDPGGGNTISIGKDVPDQISGRHRFEFDVRVSGANEASLAKIEIQTSQSGGWNKKFQLYFGSSMRVNYNKSGGAVTVVPATEMNRWYHIVCEIDLDGNQLQVWVDGQVVASGIQMHPGSIRSIAISGWDRNGAVLLDNLLGRGW